MGIVKAEVSKESKFLMAPQKVREVAVALDTYTRIT